MASLEDQIAAHEARIAKERAKLADAKAKAAAQERKRDTRRKILFGYAFLDWLTTLPQRERNRTLRLVHARLKEKERAAFPLENVLKDVEAVAKARMSACPDPNNDTGQLPF